MVLLGDVRVCCRVVVVVLVVAVAAVVIMMTMLDTRLQAVYLPVCTQMDFRESFPLH